MGAFVRWPLPRFAVVGAIVLLGAGCFGEAATVDDPTATTGRSSVEDEDEVAVEDELADEDEVAVEAGQQPEGFSTVTARITEPDGQVCDVCVWLADTPEERGRGLMGVTDLGDPVGMVFRFDEPTDGRSFYMFQTPTPLSIAWFDGTHVGSTDMAPCLDIPADDCPRYSPGAEYDLALEVFEGGLADLGVGPGSELELIDGTEADGCPLAANP